MVPTDFFSDPRVPSPKATISNTHLEWHPLVPSNIIDAFYGKEAALQTHYTTSSFIQISDFDETAWTSLLKKEVYEYLPKYSSLQHITGPLYRDISPKTSEGVAIPYAFFYIIIRSDSHCLPFIFPQQPQSEDFTTYHTTLSNIARRTSGLVPLDHLIDDTISSW